MDRHQVAHPRHRLVGGSRSARADDGLQRSHQFGLHEQFAEGRMQGIGNGRRKHHFGIAGQLDRAAAARTIVDRGASQLDIVLGRNDDLGMYVEVHFTAAEFGAGVREYGFVASRLAQ